MSDVPVFDAGAPLSSGITVITNSTGRPEPLARPDK